MHAFSHMHQLKDLVRNQTLRGLVNLQEQKWKSSFNLTFISP
jgi:hypothetical protein